MNEPKIVIYVGLQGNGYVFQPESKTRIWLEKTFPDKQRVPSLFVRMNRDRDNAQIADSMWEPIWQLVTGLSAEEINQAGGLVAVAPASEQIIYASAPIHA